MGGEGGRMPRDSAGEFLATKFDREKVLKKVLLRILLKQRSVARRNEREERGKGGGAGCACSTRSRL